MSHYMDVKPGHIIKWSGTKFPTNYRHLRCRLLLPQDPIHVSWTKRKTPRNLWQTWNWKRSATKIGYREEAPTVWSIAPPVEHVLFPYRLLVTVFYWYQYRFTHTSLLVPVYWYQLLLVPETGQSDMA